MSFASLGLHAPLLRAVTEKGYTEPTAVQQAAIPAIMSGRDLLGSSQTGTGKTAAFALPILHKLATNPVAGQSRRRPRALILAPTRELAGQIDTCMFEYGRGCNLRFAVIYGGVNQNRQTNALHKGVDVIIATPGRFLDLYQQGFIDMKGLEIVVLDEADHMLDMGFLPDVQRIMDKVPQQRQTLLFSATMPAPIRQLTEKILTNPVRIQIAPEKPTAERIEHQLIMVDRADKLKVLRQVMAQPIEGSTLVFVRTKHGADKVVVRLNRCGIAAAAIHGNKSQSARQACLQDFRNGRIKVLVATDIAARGIDVSGIQRVVNYECPETPETFVHRVGRTARAGRQGTAITLCGNDERHLVRAVERHLRMQLPVVDVRTLPAVAEVEIRNDEKPLARPMTKSPAKSPERPFARSNGSGRTRSRFAESRNNDERRSFRAPFRDRADSSRQGESRKKSWKRPAKPQAASSAKLDFSDIENLARAEAPASNVAVMPRRKRR